MNVNNINNMAYKEKITNPLKIFQICQNINLSEVFYFDRVLGSELISFKKALALLWIFKQCGESV